MTATKCVSCDLYKYLDIPMHGSFNVSTPSNELELEFCGALQAVMMLLSRSVNPSRIFLDRGSPLSGEPVLVHILSPVTDNCPS